MQSIRIGDMPFERRQGISIKKLTLDRDQVYIEDCYGALWRIVIQFRGEPVIESMPRTHLEPR